MWLNFSRKWWNNVNVFSDCYTSRKVDSSSFILGAVPDWYNAEEISDKVFSEDTFMLNYCLDRPWGTKKCVIKLLIFFTNIKIYPWLDPHDKMFKKLNDVAFSNDDIQLDDIDSDLVIFFSDDIRLITTDLNNINFDDNDS